MANLISITSLALADSVNPCALAMLLLILVVILMQDPKKKYRVLIGGACFVAAVYVGYMIYGVVLVAIWKAAAESLRTISPYVYKAFAVIAMVLGALQIKDFFYYKKGGLTTEMPLFMRPKAKRLIEKITSPWGAFSIGIFVTLFLLPCTIGPYIVASGVLAESGILAAIPWLLYYNLIFVLPMIIVIAIVYFGIAKIDEIEGWKDRNIKRLHLIAGLLLFLTGVALLLGWL